MNRHLLVNWVEEDGGLREAEEALIIKVTPLLNLDRNPHRLAEIEQARRECRKLALAR